MTIIRGTDYGEGQTRALGLKLDEDRLYLSRRHQLALAAVTIAGAIVLAVGAFFIIVASVIQADDVALAGFILAAAGAAAMAVAVRALERDRRGRR